MKVTFPAILNKVSSLKDKSYKLEFVTRELSGADAAMLLDQLMSEGFLLYSPNDDISEKDVPTEKADAGTGQKTSSQRLRAVIYVWWEQKGKPGSFEDFYRSKLEVLIEYVKEKLD
jgi:hypothetical protein